jgi:hypothetical protein
MVDPGAEQFTRRAIMNLLPNTCVRGLVALLAAAGLAACAAPDTATGHSAHATAGRSHGSAGDHMSGATAAGTSTSQRMDMTRMCAVHRDIENAPADQRQATMDKHMQQMTPEMRQRHMEMMRQHCQ